MKILKKNTTGNKYKTEKIMKIIKSILLLLTFVVLSTLCGATEQEDATYNSSIGNEIEKRMIRERSPVARPSRQHHFAWPHHSLRLHAMRTNGTKISSTPSSIRWQRPRNMRHRNRPCHRNGNGERTSYYGTDDGAERSRLWQSKNQLSHGNRQYQPHLDEPSSTGPPE